MRFFPTTFIKERKLPPIQTANSAFYEFDELQNITTDTFTTQFNNGSNISYIGYTYDTSANSYIGLLNNDNLSIDKFKYFNGWQVKNIIKDALSNDWFIIASLHTTVETPSIIARFNPTTNTFGWVKSVYDTSNNSWQNIPTNIHQLSTGEIIVLGRVTNDLNDWDLYWIKLDANNGQRISSARIDLSTNGDLLSRSILLSDNSIIICESINNFSGNSSSGVFKIDLNGNVLWTKILEGGYNEDQITDLFIYNNIVYCSGYYFNGVKNQAYYTTIDLNGNILSQHDIIGMEKANNITIHNGEIIVYGQSSTQTIVTKINNNLTVWSKITTNEFNNNIFINPQILSDKTIAIQTSSSVFKDNSLTIQPLIAKLSTGGNCCDVIFTEYAGITLAPSSLSQSTLNTTIYNNRINVQSTSSPIVSDITPQVKIICYGQLSTTTITFNKDYLAGSDLPYIVGYSGSDLVVAYTNDNETIYKIHDLNFNDGLTKSYMSAAKSFIHLGGDRYVIAQENGWQEVVFNNSNIITATLQNSSVDLKRLSSERYVAYTNDEHLTFGRFPTDNTIVGITHSSAILTSNINYYLQTSWDNKFITIGKGMTGFTRTAADINIWEWDGIEGSLPVKITITNAIPGLTSGYSMSDYSVFTTSYGIVLVEQPTKKMFIVYIDELNSITIEGPYLINIPESFNDKTIIYPGEMNYSTNTWFEKDVDLFNTTMVAVIGNKYEISTVTLDLRKNVDYGLISNAVTFINDLGQVINIISTTNDMGMITQELSFQPSYSMNKFKVFMADNFYDYMILPDNPTTLLLATSIFNGTDYSARLVRIDDAFEQ